MIVYLALIPDSCRWPFDLAQELFVAWQAMRTRQEIGYSPFRRPTPMHKKGEVRRNKLRHRKKGNETKQAWLVVIVWWPSLQPAVMLISSIRQPVTELTKIDRWTDEQIDRTTGELRNKDETLVCVCMHVRLPLGQTSDVLVAHERTWTEEMRVSKRHTRR